MLPSADGCGWLGGLDADSAPELQHPDRSGDEILQKPTKDEGRNNHSARVGPSGTSYVMGPTALPTSVARALRMHIAGRRLNLVPATGPAGCPTAEAFRAISREICDKRARLFETRRMKNLSRILGALAATLCLVSYADDAKALGPIDLEVGLKGGYATNPSTATTVSQGLGVGLGGRAGVGIFGIYGGISVVDYLGQDSDSAVAVGGELGYSWNISLLTLRPQIGIGNITQSFSSSAHLPNSNSLYLEPGLTALIGLGLFFVGADANALIITSQGNNTALTLHAQVGLKF